MVLTRPDPIFRYDGVLALRAAARVMAGEPMPSPEQVAATDLEWERDVMAAIQRIRFHEDYALRPMQMQ